MSGLQLDAGPLGGSFGRSVSGRRKRSNRLMAHMRESGDEHPLVAREVAKEMLWLVPRQLDLGLGGMGDAEASWWIGRGDRPSSHADDDRPRAFPGNPQRLHVKLQPVQIWYGRGAKALLKGAHMQFSRHSRPPPQPPATWTGSHLVLCERPEAAHVVLMHVLSLHAHGPRCHHVLLRRVERPRALETAMVMRRRASLRASMRASKAHEATGFGTLWPIHGGSLSAAFPTVLRRR